MGFKRKIPALLLLLMFVVVSGGTVQAKESVLVVAPFEIKSEADLAYLEKAMMDMFSSRLYMEGKVRVIANPEGVSISGENGAKLLSELEVDYLLFGTLTQSGRGIAIDVGLLQAGDISNVKRFSAKSGEYETVNELIGLVDRVCAEINRTVFGKAPEASKESAVKKDTYNVHSHPDTMLDLLEK